MVWWLLVTKPIDTAKYMHNKGVTRCGGIAELGNMNASIHKGLLGPYLWAEILFIKNEVISFGNSRNRFVE